MADHLRDKFGPTHTLKNHLAIIVGFSDLLLSEMNTDDPHRNDVTEINAAARAALEELAVLAGKLPH